MVLLVSACRLLDFDSCLYELRGVTVEGTLKDSPTDSLYVYLSVNEQRDYQPNKSMSWRLASATLKGHVTSVTLRDAAAESPGLYLFPFNGFNDNISAGTVSQSEGANLNGFFDVLAGGRGVIDVRTESPGKEQVRFIPPIRSQQDWVRPKCG